MHIIKSSLLILVFSIGMVGCLKDKLYDNGQIQSLANSNVKVVSLGINVSSASNMALYAYTNSNNDTVVNLIPVELGGPVDAPQDIHVTVVQEDTLINAFNNDSTNMANGNFLTIPTPAQFSVVNAGGVVVIPKGKRVGFLQIKFVPSSLIGITYGLGFGIKSVTESGYIISGNVGTGIVSILIKNAYDGLYVMDQKTTGWGAFGINDGGEFEWPSNIVFATVGANSNLITTQEAGSAQVGFSPTGGLASFGFATPQYNFDPASNNLTSVTNLTPDARNRQFPINPAAIAGFDPTTHNIILNYELTQGGRPTMFIYDTLTYVGPR